MTELQKSASELWKGAFLRLFPKAKQLDTDALSALRNHYYPIVTRIVNENGIEESTLDVCFKRAFAKMIRDCDSDLQEDEFCEQLTDIFKNEITDTVPEVIFDTPPLENSGKVKRNVRTISEFPQEKENTQHSVKKEHIETVSSESSSAIDHSAEIERNKSLESNPEKRVDNRPTDLSAAAKNETVNNNTSAAVKPDQNKAETEAVNPQKINEPNKAPANNSPVTLAVIFVLLGICLGIVLMQQKGRASNSTASSAVKTNTPEATISSAQEDVQIWVKNPVFAFDSVSELNTYPFQEPGIFSEYFGYPQEWNSDYESNAIQVSKDGKYGVYDYNGNNLIPVSLNWLSQSPTGLKEKDIFICEYLRDPYYITTDFRHIRPMLSPGMGSEGNGFFAMKNGVFGFVTVKGGTRTFAASNISNLDMSSRNVIWVVDDNCYKDGWVFIDHKGNILNGPFYNRPADSVFSNPFINSMVCVLNADYEPQYIPESVWKIAFVNANTGIQITDYLYDNAKYFSNGFAPVMKDGKWGYIDEQGNEVSDFIFDDASALYEGKAYVKFNGYYGILDVKTAVENNIRITYDSCYISPSDLTIVNAPQGVPDIVDASIGEAVVKVDKLNIRSYGSTSSKKVGRCNTGDTFSVYEYFYDGTYTWYRIGEEKWIADKNGQYVHFQSKEY